MSKLHSPLTWLLAAIALPHELGHYAVAWSLGYRGVRLRLAAGRCYVAGMRWEHEPWVAVAGPMGDLAMASVLVTLGQWPMAMVWVAHAMLNWREVLRPRG